MSAALLASVLGVGGFSAILAAIVTGLFSKRRLGAEAAEIITKAAAGVVTSLQGEVDRQQALRVKMLADHEATVAEIRVLLAEHREWSRLAIAELQASGITLPPPPRLPMYLRVSGD